MLNNVMLPCVNIPFTTPNGHAKLSTSVNEDTQGQDPMLLSIGGDIALPVLLTGEAIATPARADFMSIKL